MGSCFQCKMCQRCVSSKQSLVSHMKSTHTIILHRDSILLRRLSTSPFWKQITLSPVKVVLKRLDRPKNDGTLQHKNTSQTKNKNDALQLQPHPSLDNRTDEPNPNNLIDSRFSNTENPLHRGGLTLPIYSSDNNGGKDSQTPNGQNVDQSFKSAMASGPRRVLLNVNTRQSGRDKSLKEMENPDQSAVVVPQLPIRKNPDRSFTLKQYAYFNSA